MADQVMSDPLQADFSALERRILEHRLVVVGAQNGEDVHKALAAEVFGVPLESVTPEQRRTAKNILLQELYFSQIVN